MHDKGELPLTLTFLLMTEGTSVTGEGLKPRPVSLSPTKRNIITNGGSEARLVKAWETTL